MPGDLLFWIMVGQMPNVLAVDTVGVVFSSAF